jgi:hypothetical protein
MTPAMFLLVGFVIAATIVLTGVVMVILAHRPEKAHVSTD